MLEGIILFVAAFFKFYVDRHPFGNLFKSYVSIGIITSYTEVLLLFAWKNLILEIILLGTQNWSMQLNLK